jgi:hypothetical protein
MLYIVFVEAQLRLTLLPQLVLTNPSAFQAEGEAIAAVATLASLHEFRFKDWAA